MIPSDGGLLRIASISSMTYSMASSAGKMSAHDERRRDMAENVLTCLFIGRRPEGLQLESDVLEPVRAMIAVTLTDRTHRVGHCASFLVTVPSPSVSIRSNIFLLLVRDC